MTTDNTASEKACLDAIRYHRERYEAAIKPYVDCLVRLNSLRPPPPIVLTIEQAKQLGLIP